MTLEDAARDGIVAHDPDLVIVLGGPVAIADGILTALSQATGLAITSDENPTDGIVRVAGENRYLTAAAVARLLAAYNPAFLPVDATALGAVDADTLDGLDAAAFAPADHTHVPEVASVYVGFSPVANDSTVVAASVDVTPDDPCGGGTTEHRYLVHYTATARLPAATAGDAAVIAVQLVQGAESADIGSLNGIPRIRQELTVPASNQQLTDTLAITRFLTGVGPGATTIRAELVNDSAINVDLLYGELTAQHLGWVCP